MAVAWSLLLSVLSGCLLLCKSFTASVSGLSEVSSASMGTVDLKSSVHT